MKLNPDDITMKYSDQEYREHIATFNADPDTTEQRFVAWANANETDLLSIYLKRVKDADHLARKNCFADWVRQCFIIKDFNHYKEVELQREIDLLMGA
jgi:uncharacterized protein with von Willebrand factor type A (vWA) domain